MGNLGLNPRRPVRKAPPRSVLPPFVFAGSAQLNGTNQYLEAPALAAGAFPQELAVQMWLQPLAAAANKLLFNTRTTRALSNEAGLDSFGLGGALRMYATNAAGTRTFSDSGYVLAVGSTYHLYMDWSQPLSRYRLFVNGALVTEHNSVTTWPASMLTAAFSPANYLNGKLAALAVWYANLAPAQVQQLYHAGRGLAPSGQLSAGVQGYWPCTKRTSGSPVSTPSGLAGGAVLNAPSDFSLVAF